MDGKNSGIEPIGYIEMPGTAVEMPDTSFTPSEPNQPVRQADPPPTASTAERSAQREQRPRGVRGEVGRRARLGRVDYISATASVLGDVVLGEEVFVGPGASVRGDTGAQIRIGNQSNVQDGAVVHADSGRSLVVGNVPYAVYIGDRVSLGHQCLVHGPAAILDGSFIGYGSLVVNSTIGRDCVVMHLAYVANVEIPDGRLVPVGAVVDTPERARSLPRVPADLKGFAAESVRAYTKHARDYNE
jgi:carbonic anhydrase